MLVALFVLQYWLGDYLASGQGLAIQAPALAALLIGGLTAFSAVILLTGVLTPAQLGRFFRRKSSDAA